MPTPRGAASLVLGIAVYVIARGFGAGELVPLAVALVAAPIVALAFLGLVRPAARLSRAYAPQPATEGGDVRVALRVAPVPRIITRGVLLDDDGTRTVLRRRGTALVAGRRLGALRRGVYRSDDGVLILGDPFGLVERHVPVGGGRVLVVRPRVPGADGEWEGSAGAESARSRLRLTRPIGFDLHAVRDHQPGESLRRVDWKSTAKRSKLMVREMEDAPSADVAILLDLDAVRYGQPGGADAVDEAVRAAAALGRAGWLRGREVAIIAAGAEARTWTFHDGGRQWEQALDGLAAVRPDRTSSLATVLADPSILPRARTLIVITPDPTAAARPAPGIPIEQRRRVLVDVASYAGAPGIALGADPVLCAGSGTLDVLREVAA